jgi:hypothetical protein
MALLSRSPATPCTCVPLAELEDALGWLAVHDGGPLAVRLRALAQFDRDGLVSIRALGAALEQADAAALEAARTLPRPFAGSAAQALRVAAGAVLAQRAAAA